MLQIHHSLRVLTAGAYEETKIIINAINTKKVIQRQLVKL